MLKTDDCLRLGDLFMEEQSSIIESSLENNINLLSENFLGNSNLNWLVYLLTALKLCNLFDELDLTNTIKTNDKVIFTSWDNNGERHIHNKKKGECWFLDTRRPHTAINGGDDIRIHLVADVWANDDVRNILT